MRDAIIIFLAIIFSMVIGSYFFLTDSLRFTTPEVPGANIQNRNFTILHEGPNSGSIDRRTNYRIVNEEEFIELWRLIYGTQGSTRPPVNFTMNEVIAVFDGTHSSGGYRVSVTDVVDAGGVRTVHILREEPGEGCITTEAITSPFQIVRVSKTTLPIVREEQTVTTQCQ